jgi:hypothetical protein
VPADNSADPKWFVVWPSGGDDTRIIVRANPLNPEVQKKSAAAMEDINAAVAAAERRAQAAYDKAMEQLRRTGKGGDLDTVTLDDEGIAGERIDAEQEVTIELHAVEPFAINSGEPPRVLPGRSGANWLVTVAAHTYRAKSGPDLREHFRAAEAIVYFNLAATPKVSSKGDARFFVEVAPSPKAFAVIVRGNEALVNQLATETDWSQLASR